MDVVDRARRLDEEQGYTNTNVGVSERLISGVSGAVRGLRIRCVEVDVRLQSVERPQVRGCAECSRQRKRADESKGDTDLIKGA